MGQKKYYLNDYFPEVPRFRIELKRGPKVICTEIRTLGSMEKTKAYIESVWGK